jgi:tetratricopeptide (TPR) repeat protein
VTFAAHLDPTSTDDAALREAEALVETFTRLGDEAGLARAWQLLARIEFFLGHTEAAGEGYAQAVEHARRIGDRITEFECLSWWMAAKRYGPASVAEALTFYETLSEQAAVDARVAAYVYSLRGALLAMQERFDEARAHIQAAKQRAEESGLALSRGAIGLQAGTIEILARDFSAAERELRESVDALAAIGETGFRSTLASMLADVLVELGREEEAEAVLDEVERVAQADDVDPQARMRAVRARLLASRGLFEEAELLAREAVELYAKTDYLEMRGEMLGALASVLEVAGRREEAAGALRAALELYERKGAVVLSRRTRDRLAGLEATPKLA